MTSPARRTAHRTAAAAVGLVMAASLGVSAPTATAQASADPGCETDVSHARLAFGHTMDREPNAVSQAQVAAVERQLAPALARVPARGLAPVEIRVFAHIIKPTNPRSNKGATREMVRDQIAVLNEAFGGETSGSSVDTPFTFRLQSTSVTRKSTWYAWPMKADGSETGTVKKAKRQLHRGTKADLNLYTAEIGGGILGYARFPFQGNTALDGVVLLDETLPGGSAVGTLGPYNQGDTGTHEVGHWLGLFHTFQGGCIAPGDGVDDTPAQNNGDNIFYCGNWPDDSTNPDDTCLSDPGVDPVRNFMSYGVDTCLNQFTPGQDANMQAAWTAFRAP